MNRNAKGAGMFTSNPNGTVTYRKGVGIKTDGKRKTLTVTAKNKSVCIQLMKEKERDWEEKKRKKVINQNDTLENLCLKHLEVQNLNKELKPKSYDRRECTIKNQIAKYSLGHMQLQAISSVDIDNYVSELIQSGLSASSIEKAIDVISSAFNWAISRGEYQINPIAPIKKSLKKRLAKLKTKTETDSDVIILSDEEIEKFLATTLIKNANNGEFKYAGALYGRLLLHTGMRVGEMISLHWHDYDEENGLLTINKSTSVIKNRDKNGNDKEFISFQGTTKNQKARVIQLSEEAKEDLAMIKETRSRPKQEDLICLTRTNKPYTATMVEHCVKTIYKNAGLSEKISGLHIFRRTFATKMYDNGAGVKEIAAYIGDLESTTMQYYIAARKNMKVGAENKMIVPLPINKNVPAANKDI